MLLASILVAGGLLVSTMGIRPDFVAVLDTVRFPFKFVVTLALAVSAGGCSTGRCCRSPRGVRTRSCCWWRPRSCCWEWLWN